jgi:hypothetical protein
LERHLKEVESDIINKIISILKKKKGGRVAMNPSKMGSQHNAPGRLYPGGPRPLPGK